ncbi:P-loop containing nucleoside triphosphate hydrolase [Chloropicon primus]|uniref:P-loop containing nucleoside triphosphate hydrolase n=2 Tax=Chloropicon primus TaxID=1764295 RepID=A0A5B8MG67_9CHLO|nr:P-loop containing nucleoside triphosphate hydrolase [Chloropicon primus]UPQ97551.1 P-loop containing nucleoside triphosphate hydrolase [Chloropicon primus]|eukprot:QDZ18340.1 P-loop containing nucleoside triphosphate hydrolase [Chloropicon primus]
MVMLNGAEGEESRDRRAAPAVRDPRRRGLPRSQSTNPSRGVVFLRDDSHELRQLRNPRRANSNRFTSSSGRSLQRDRFGHRGGRAGSHRGGSSRGGGSNSRGGGAAQAPLPVQKIQHPSALRAGASRDSYQQRPPQSHHDSRGAGRGQHHQSQLRASSSRAPSSRGGGVHGNDIHSHVVGGVLFNSGCQRSKGELKPLPNEFGHVSEYSNAYKPLLLEEARASVRRNWEEECENKRLYRAQLLWVTEKASGQTGNNQGKGTQQGGSLVATFQFDKNQIGKKPKMMNQDVLVFADRPPAVQVNATEWLSGELKKKFADGYQKALGAAAGNPGMLHGLRRVHVVCFAGIVVNVDDRNASKPTGTVKVEVFPRCSMYPKCGGECAKHVNEEELVARLKAKQTWHFAQCSSLVTVKREFLALNSLNSNHALLPGILKPKSMRRGLKRGTDGAPLKPTLPSECSGQLFQKFLEQEFNAKQYEAVCTAASQMAITGRNEIFNSFTLVHGPPGTGKTHTIWGILNVVHIVCFQRYYKKITNAVMRSFPQKDIQKAYASSSMSRQEALKLCDCLLNADLEAQKRVLHELAPKPRILVCAPSNAAVDEMCKRVVLNGFKQMNMQKYDPRVVRVAAGNHPLSDILLKVSSRRQAEGYLALSGWDWEKRFSNSKNAVENSKKRIQHLVLQIKHQASAIKHQAKALDSLQSGRENDSDQQRDLRQAMGQLEGSLVALAKLHENREENVNELERLKLCKSIVQRGHSDELLKRDSMEALEITFLRDAEIVFTTLSSSANRSFRELNLKFEVVLIDEAAQAGELECLQPLQYGARHCVLVGDPQQLPATILSTLAAKCSYGRSMLERFSNDGVYAIQLCEQFRMHPGIREFPSKYFYEGKLEDAPCIKDRAQSKSRSTIYKFVKASGKMGQISDQEDQSLLDKPYTVFNVRGTNTRNAQGSLANRDEVRAVVQLYNYLMNKVAPLEPVPAADESAGNPPQRRRYPPCGMSVGIITPYRYQRDLIREAFEKKYGSVGWDSRANNVRIDTIDSFQGKERDVIILSCVRAHQKGKSPKEGDLLGFVSDIRRMNVAITRSKMLLWIVGDLDTLQADKAWKALIQDAMERQTLRFDVKELCAKWDKEEGEL